MERYESLGVVGEGSYGVVLKCRHRETGQIVAVKKFLESDEDHNVKKIAMREVRMLKKLRHENLINLIEFFRRKRRLYLVFEYVDHTVLDELEECDSGGLEPGIARSHIFQVIRGVAFCHLNQIIHRDVKPENVLVSRLGVVKLCDFGFARTLEGPNETCTDYVATRWYRAPELLVGDTKYGREVDIWAIGCLLAEILSGEPLFPGESDIDQLFHIIQTLGELSSSHRHLINKNPMLSGLHLPAGASTPLSVTFPKWPLRTLAFISECLDLSPSKRPSSEGLLKNEYFTHDSFPNIFLPELQKKVQQEFISNSLLQQPNCRKGSAQGDKKVRKSKNVSPQQSQSFKYVPKTQPTSRASPKKLRNQAPIFSAASFSQQELPNTYSTPVLQSHFQITNHQSSNLQAQSISLSQIPHPSYAQAQLPTSHQSHIPTPSLTHNASTTRSFVTYPPNPTSKGNTFPFDEGPSSLPYSQIPPIKETQAINNETLNNFPIFQNEPQLPSSTFSFHANRNANTQAMLSLQLMLSPSRSFRKEEKSKKSPQGLWSTGTKGLSIQGQNQFLNFSVAEPPTQKESRSQFTNDPPTTTTATSLAPISPFSRHHQFDSGRHPYAISLDRSKEASARDINRDPLREIKENSREGRKDTMSSNNNNNNNNNNGNTMAKDTSRRTRKESTNWAKPRLLNDDLYLPDVPGVSSKQICSPSKTSRTEIIAGEGFSRNVGQSKEKKSSVGLMPHIGGLVRGSASSTDSFETLNPGSNLPYVCSK